MVEVKGEEREQAEALTLLLQAVHTSPHLAAQYAGIRGNSLIFRILMSPLASPGVQVIKVIGRRRIVSPECIIFMVL